VTNNGFGTAFLATIITNSSGHPEKVSFCFFSFCSDLKQGCQIFLGPNIPKWKKYQMTTSGHKLYPMAVNIPNGHKIYKHFPL
jgi:hypothetical protein